MQKIFTLFFLVITTTTFAQKINFYRDSTYTMPYIALTNTTSVNNGQFWDDPDYTMPIGFTFKFFGDSSNTLYFDDILGYGASFKLTPTPTNPIGAKNSLIYSFGADLIDKDTSGLASLSPIAYAITGTQPNRIFKLEFKNAGFYTPIGNGALADSINFQVWLYEKTNIIETHFGPNNLVSPITDIYDGGPGAWIGLYDSLVADSVQVYPLSKEYTLTNSLTSPTLDSSSVLGNFLTIGNTPGMTGNPTNGSVYRFIPSNVIVFAAGVKNTYLKTNTNITLNNNTLTVLNNTSQKLDVNILDMQGKSVFKKALNTASTNYNISFLASGIYTVTLSNATSTITYKIAK